MSKVKNAPINRLESNGNGHDPLVGDMAVAEAQAKTEKQVINVKPLNLRILEVIAVGTAPLMQLRFSAKAIGKMMATHEAGGQAKSKKNREARDFDDDYLQAFHRFPNGDNGLPAAAIRAACISACRTISFKMTLAKLSIFCLADGLDVVDGAPLVRVYGQPEKTILPVRNANGSADLRVRPMWRQWAATVRMRFDQDQFSAGDCFNLLARAGAQVGVGEGRPDSRESAGLGYGTFRLLLPDDAVSDEEFQTVLKAGCNGR
jgi:hypothetical protein